MPLDDGPDVPTDGDDRPMGGTNRLAGLSGLALGFLAVLVLLIVAGIVLTLMTGRAGPNL